MNLAVWKIPVSGAATQILLIATGDLGQLIRPHSCLNRGVLAVLDY